MDLHPLDGSFRIEARLADPRKFSPRPTSTTQYPLPLIERLLRFKGPAWICHEIEREQDPRQVEHHLRRDLFGFPTPDSFADRRLPELGCGCATASAGDPGLILGLLDPSGESARSLSPRRLGLSDHLDLWF